MLKTFKIKFLICFIIMVILLAISMVFGAIGLSYATRLSGNINDMIAFNAYAHRFFTISALFLLNSTIPIIAIYDDIIRIKAIEFEEDEDEI